MDKLKLAQFGERLMIGGAQMGRMVSGKMKEILQSPTPESKMVDEATMETMPEANWGMNLRICAMINSGEFNGAEIVKAIKKKVLGKSVASQMLSLDLLEACTMNCEKVFSEVASEKVLEEMVKMIDNPQTDQGNRTRALQLIRAWGESEDLAYLPVFRQTYMSLKGRRASLPVEDGGSPPMQHSHEPFVHQQALSPSEEYPFPNNGHGDDQTNLTFNYAGLSDEEKKEFLVVTRNSLDLLASILNTETEPNAVKDDLTVSMLEKCMQSQLVVQRIIEATTDDEGMLFEALNLHEELQQVISRCEEQEAGLASEGQQPKDSEATTASSLAQARTLKSEGQEQDPQNCDTSEPSLHDQIGNLKLEEQQPGNADPAGSSSASEVSTHEEGNKASSIIGETGSESHNNKKNAE